MAEESDIHYGIKRAVQSRVNLRICDDRSLSEVDSVIKRELFFFTGQVMPRGGDMAFALKEQLGGNGDG